MANFEVRMIRAKLMLALADPKEWVVESETKAVRKSDGLWVAYGEGSVGIGSSEHGIPQATFEGDDEVFALLTQIFNVGIGGDPARRPILKMLGVSVDKL